MTNEIAFTELLTAVINRQDLSSEDACITMRRIMDGEFSSPQIAALAVALRVKGETED